MIRNLALADISRTILINTVYLVIILILTFIFFNHFVNKPLQTSLILLETSHLVKETLQRNYQSNLGTNSPSLQTITIDSLIQLLILLER